MDERPSVFKANAYTDVSIGEMMLSDRISVDIPVGHEDWDSFSASYRGTVADLPNPNIMLSGDVIKYGGTLFRCVGTRPMSEWQEYRASEGFIRLANAFESDAMKRTVVNMFEIDNGHMRDGRLSGMFALEDGKPVNVDLRDAIESVAGRVKIPAALSSNSGSPSDAMTSRNISDLRVYSSDWNIERLNSECGYNFALIEIQKRGDAIGEPERRLALSVEASPQNISAYSEWFEPDACECNMTIPGMTTKFRILKNKITKSDESIVTTETLPFGLQAEVQFFKTYGNPVLSGIPMPDEASRISSLVMLNTVTDISGYAEGYALGRQSHKTILGPQLLDSVCSATRTVVPNGLTTVEKFAKLFSSDNVTLMNTIGAYRPLSSTTWSKSRTELSTMIITIA